jgi:galactokinase
VNHREALLETVTSGFARHFGEPPKAVYAAPGRVNLIGEHTDYNDGLVLPCAIDRETMIAVGPSEAGRVDAIALDLDNQRDSFSLAEAIEPGEHEWGNHLRGVAHFLSEQGAELKPMRLAVAGNIPMGAGLSSSASLGVAAGLALTSEAGDPKRPEILAKVAQAAENTFVGTQCGIMDQMASACGKEGSALLLDCRDLSYRHIAMPATLSLLVVDSGVRHSLGDSPYNERRAQCEVAARHYGAASLREVSLSQLEADRAGLDPVAYRRARHVVTEIGRVTQFASALEAGDVQAISALMTESYQSYRDDFEASVPEVDHLFEKVSEVLGKRGGVRLTGGGFGGSLVALTPPDLVDEIRTAVAPASAEVFLSSGGARQLV